MKNNYNSRRERTGRKNKPSGGPGSEKRITGNNRSTGKKPSEKPAKYRRKDSKTSFKSKTEVSDTRPGTKSRTYKKMPKHVSSHNEMRLNRFIANAGVCSRREADKYIEAGLITVNGKTVTELGVKVKQTDDVRFNGQRLNAEKKVYLLLNKPRDYVTTTDDPHAERTVMDLVKNACKERIYPVGRLDRNTTGLLLFTNDGDLSKRLTHPSHNVKKIYQVSLNKPLTKQHMQEIADGIELEDGQIHADEISYINQEEKNEIGIEIHSGRNRIIRRIFEHLDYRVKKLDRASFAGLTKKNLPRGKWRFLSDKEVQYLKMK